MPQPRVLMLTYPPAWAKQLRNHFRPEQVDILVKARTPDDTLLAEHDLYEPCEVADLAMPEGAFVEVELSLRRCYIGSAVSVADLARQIFANAERMLARGGYERIVFRTVPHMPHEFAIYHCAQKLGIQTVFFDETGYFDRAFVFTDIYVRRPETAIALEGQPAFSFTPEQRKIASLNDLRKNYHGLRKVGQGPLRNLAKIARAYLYIIKASLIGDNVAGSAGLSRNISRSNMLDRLAFWTKNIVKTASLRRVLSGMEARGPGNSPIQDCIIFLLNFQPERTTLPDAYPYYDLVQAAAELSGTGRQILVKEHPIQLNYPGDGALLRGATWRSRQFYEELSRVTSGFLPRGREIDENLAIDNLIATATGTVAVEMFFRKIPVLVLANNWVASLPNVVRPATLDASREPFAYDPFGAFEAIFSRTVEVIKWGQLSTQDVSILRQVVDGPAVN